MDASQSDKQHKRYDILDGMRGIAAFAVMLAHFTQHTSFEILNNVSLSVDFFFILSGFVLALSYSAKLRGGMPLAEYLLRRFIRLYPMFLAGLLLGGAVLMWMGFTGAADYSQQNILASLECNALFLPYINMLGIRSFGIDTPILGEVFPANPALWSLFFEMAASGAFILLLKLNIRALMRVMAISFVLFVLNGIFLAHARGHWGPDMGAGWGTSNLSVGFPRVIFGFSLGMLLYALVNTESIYRENLARKFFSCHSYLLYAAMIAVFAVPTQLKGLYPIVILLTLAPFLVFIGTQTVCKSDAELKVARTLGWLSYPVYCLHFPLGRLVLGAGQGHMPRPVLILITLALTVALSILATKFYEEPVRGYLSKKLSGLPVWARLAASPR